MTALLLLSVLTARPDGGICTVPYPAAGNYITATAVVPSTLPNAQQAAADAARRNLRERLCTSGDCSALEPSIREWKASESANSVCAGAAIDEEDYRAWQTRDLVADRAFRVELAADVSAVVSRLKREGNSAPLVALDDVLDDGTIGGMRSRWVRFAVLDALRSANADLADLNRSSQVPTLTVEVVTVDASNSTLQLQLHTGARMFPGARINFPNAVAPRTRRADHRTQHDPRLRLHVETRKGDLCDGMATRLSVESDKKRCVVVLDTWKDDAVLLFPNKAQPSCVVEPGTPFDVSGPGPFRLIALPGVDEERYVAFAAERLELLPSALQKMVKGLPATESCRLSETNRARIDEDVPSSIAKSELRIRVISGGAACDGIDRLSVEERAAYLRDLARLPTCP